MQLNALETLLMVSRVGSFSRAAELRNMTLSALSMQMKSLEDELGTSLFDRAFRPPKLTPIGELVAIDALQVVEAEAALRSRCTQSDRLVGTIQMGFVPSTAVRMLPNFLKRVTNVAPDANIFFVSGLSETLCVKVRRGQLDAALVTEVPDATHDLLCAPLVQEEMVLVAPSAARNMNLTELSRSLPFIHFRPHSGIGKLIAQYCMEMQLEMENVIVLDSIEASVNCVRRNLGYSLLPKPDVQNYGDDNIYYFSCSPRPIYRQLSLVTRDDVLSQLWQPHLSEILHQSLSEDEF